MQAMAAADADSNVGRLSFSRTLRQSGAGLKIELLMELNSRFI